MGNGIRINFGIIDYLQSYNMTKGAEHFYKKIKNWDMKGRATIQPPEEYADRFIEKITNKYLRSLGGSKSFFRKLTGSTY
jgi:hypothetical protein